MNPERLLQHFDRISEAPDAIPRLRRFILDLAVRGKLVEQDSNDEPAAELFDRLASCMVVFNQQDGAHRRKEIETPKAEFFGEQVFPASWIVTNFDRVNAIVSGVAKGKNLRGLETATYPYLRVANVQRGYLDLSLVKEIEIRADEFDRYRLQSGDVLMTEGGDWDKLGRAAIWDEEVPNCIHQNHIYRIRSAIRNQLLPQWIVLFANSHLGRSYFEDASKQTTNLASINMTQLRSCPLPLPPTREQHRIVAKVDELMALCDQLEAARTEREQSRDRLVAASLHRLNQPADTEEANTPEAFRDHARFYFNHLPRLTTRPEHIKQLRQTILNLAVRGKLVPQDPNDEPASELLSRICAENPRLRESSKETVESAEATDGSLDIPETWSAVALGQILKVTSSKRIFQSEYSEPGVPFFRSKEIGELSRGEDIKTSLYISADRYRELRKHADFPKPGDLLLTSVGTIGNTWLVDDREFYFKDGNITHIIQTEGIEMRYVQIYIASPLFTDAVTRTVAGTAYNALTIVKIKGLIFPLPPLVEQRRIIAKVDELMALCDQIETQLTITEADSRRLLEAVLYEALTPALEEAA